MKKLFLIILSIVLLFTLIACATSNNNNAVSTEDSDSIANDTIKSSDFVNTENEITLSPAPTKQLQFISISELATFVELLDGDEKTLIEYVTEIKHDSEERYTNALFEVTSKEELVEMWREIMSVSVPVGVEDFAIHYFKDQTVCTIQFVNGVRVSTRTCVDDASADENISADATATIIRNINIEELSVGLAEITAADNKYRIRGYVTLDSKPTTMLFEPVSEDMIPDSFPTFKVKTVAEIVAEYIGKP